MYFWDFRQWFRRHLSPWFLQRFTKQGACELWDWKLQNIQYKIMWREKRYNDCKNIKIHTKKIQNFSTTHLCFQDLDASALEKAEISSNAGIMKSSFSLVPYVEIKVLVHLVSMMCYGNNYQSQDRSNGQEAALRIRPNLMWCKQSVAL